MNDTLKQIYQSVLKGKWNETKQWTHQALEEGISVQDIISKGMNAAMDEVGLLFSRNEIFLPEMMIAARAMKAGMEILEPLIVNQEVQQEGKVVLGTVKGDLHDVGKNLVMMMLKGAGFAIIDLGVDVPKEQFKEAIIRENPQIVGISALLSTVLPNVSETANYLKDSGVLNTCKLLIGGAVITPEFAQSVGSDGYAADAGAAVG
ncbi:MAG: cobalamin B12-binding domain-containing protein, partial [Deltaproteobacteria bacterium]|nr:cobalamin B12-binding domain-containing protein [Deltaproteobacteria bacterium]